MEKILHVVVCTFYVEGAGYQENLLPRAHKQQGYDVTIVTKQNNKLGIIGGLCMKKVFVWRSRATLLGFLQHVWRT